MALGFRASRVKMNLPFVFSRWLCVKVSVSSARVRTSCMEMFLWKVRRSCILITVLTATTMEKNSTMLSIKSRPEASCHRRFSDKIVLLSSLTI